MCWGIQSSVYGTKTKNKNVATLKVQKFYLDLCKYTQKLFLFLLKLMSNVLRDYWDEDYGQYLT